MWQVYQRGALVNIASVNAHLASRNMGGYGRLLSDVTVLTPRLLAYNSWSSCCKTRRARSQQELRFRAMQESHQGESRNIVS